MKFFYRNFLLVCLLLSINFCYAQYQVNGDAFSTGSGCYQLTANTTAQVGSVWNTNLINLNNAFDFTFNVFLGCDDAGADGICFGLQPLSTTIGISGNGMGLGSVSPSLGVYIDTYQNSSPDFDPAYDHISINANGDVDHSTANNLVGPVQASSTNADIEDCGNHTLRVQWNPITQTYQVWFDGVLRLTYVGDIINNIFGGNPNVYWGFTGSTGGLTNQQSFCIIVAANFSANTVCVGNDIQFTDLSTSGTTISSWSWNFGDGTPVFTGTTASTYQNPSHSYSIAGTYDVTEVITNTSGETSTVSHNVTVLAPPTATASGGTTICGGQSVPLTGTVGGPSNTPVAFNSIGAVAIPDGGVSFGWDGITGTQGIDYGVSNIAVSGLNAGWTFSSVTLNITHTWDSDVIVYLFDPCGNSILLIDSDGGSSSNFTNTSFSTSATIAIGSASAPFNGTFVPEGGTAAWNAFITASQGCASANGTWSIHIGDQATTDSGTLTSWSLNFNNPTTPTYTWAPTINMSNSTTLNPTVTPTVTTTYTLTASNSYGCTSTATTVVIVSSTLSLTVNSPTICAGQTTCITANGGNVYVWSNASTSNQICVTPILTTSYSVTASDVNGCTGTTISSVTVIPNPTASFTASPTSGTPPLTVDFTNTSQNGTTYTWIFGDGNTANTFDATNTYNSIDTYNPMLIVSNGNCSDTVTKSIEVFSDYYLFVPNVFTPNNDNTNDVFTITSKGLSTLDAEIYNRWGLKLYEWHTITGGWDGKTAVDGTYYYIVKAKNFDGIEHIEKGSFSLFK